MTLFAVACAGMFPLIHMGRPWLAYWIFPYPNTMKILAEIPQSAGVGRLRGVHLRDASLLFWFIGLIPDLATFVTARKIALQKWSTGFWPWAGADRPVHWSRYETAYLLLGWTATPLVVSVHTIVSFDFAIAIVPGGTTTIFPPYFVAGAIYSGLRHGADARDSRPQVYAIWKISSPSGTSRTPRKVMLATGLIVAYG